MNWAQLQTIFWLRWRLTRNQWARSGGFGAVFAAVVMVAALTLGGLSFCGGLVGGALGLGSATPMVLLGIWSGLVAGFLFFWLIGLVSELQRSETIDLQRLMHLPVALGQMFVVNYAASHLAVSIVLFLPAMTGLALGLVYSRGFAMLLLLPLAYAMIFMITAWTYCLCGWLAAMMTNPRRRRAIIMGITMAFVLIGQLPNLYFNVLGRAQRAPIPPGATPNEVQSIRRQRQDAEKEMLNNLLAVQKFIPPFWVSVGAQGLAEHRVVPALLGTFGCFGLGALGLRRAYRSTLRFYQGETGGKAASPKPVDLPEARPGAAAKPATSFLTWRVPGVPEQAGALALATFRSMLRAPEIKMAWGTSFLVTIILAATFLFRAKLDVPEAAKPFIATGSVVFSIFMLIQFFANQFGFDRDGFRALILCPAERRLILLGKNLASAPAGFGFGALLLGLMAVRLHLSLLTLVAAFFQLVALLLLAALCGNLLSILVPYRVQAGSLKPTKMPAGATLLMVACQLMFPVVMLPALVPPLMEFLWRGAGWPEAVPVNLLLSILLAGLMIVVYWQALTPLGRLLQRRETRILNTIAAEVE